MYVWSAGGLTAVTGSGGGCDCRPRTASTENTKAIVVINASTATRLVVNMFFLLFLPLHLAARPAAATSMCE